MSCSDRQYLEIIKNIPLLENLFWLCSSHQTTLQPSESTACAGFAASVSFKLSWLSKTLTIKRPIPGPLTRNHKTMDVSRTKPKAHVTWHYVGILSEFIPADRSLSSSKGRKVMKRQVSVSVSVSSPTSNSCFISNPYSSAHKSWTQHGLYRSHFKETRQTSTNPQFYQVWSGLIWNNTCKIDLKTWSVTDPIVGGLRPRLQKHPQMEYLVSQAQTSSGWPRAQNSWYCFGQIIGRLKTFNCKVIFIWGCFSSWVSTGHTLLQGSPLPPALSSSHCLQTSGRSFSGIRKEWATQNMFPWKTAFCRYTPLHFGLTEETWECSTHFQFVCFDICPCSPRTTIPENWKGFHDCTSLKCGVI